MGIPKELEIGSAERVLLLRIPEASVWLPLARALRDGLLVGLGGEEEVRAARAAGRDLDNVMFTPGEPYDVPWQDGFFSLALGPAGPWPEPERTAIELRRVLGAPGRACIVADDALAAALVASGFLETAPATEGWRCFSGLN